MSRFATPYGAFEIDSLPSQVQVAICHGFFVKPDLRGQGLAALLKERQNEEIAKLGYDFAICTVAADNVRQRRTLERAGWHKVAEFHSKRQDQLIEIWGFEP